MNYSTYQSDCPRTTSNFSDDILAILVKEKNRCSMSHLKSSLISMGWKRLGGTVEFQDKIEAAGFTLDHEYSKDSPNSITRTYITL